MDATLPFRWRRSPSHGKCSRRFCGSLRNYGRSHHQHQRETLDGHALKSNRREECVLMPAKMSRSAPRPPFRLREVSIAVRTLRLSCRKAGKAPIFTPVRESSGESRIKALSRITERAGDRQEILMPELIFAQVRTADRSEFGITRATGRSRCPQPDRGA